MPSLGPYDYRSVQKLLQEVDIKTTAFCHAWSTAAPLGDVTSPSFRNGRTSADLALSFAEVRMIMELWGWPLGFLISQLLRCGLAPEENRSID